MLEEASLLKLYLSVALIAAPQVANSFFIRSKLLSLIHIFAAAIVIFAIYSNQKVLSFCWPVFCFIHLAFYFKLGTKSKTTNLISFFFSFVASIWIVAGTNNYYLLGYDQNWSYYAALHGHFLGWIFFGCLAFLEQNSQRFKGFYRTATYIGVALFLLVAFGINGIPIIKAIGAIGLCILIPTTVALFCIESKNSMAKILGQITFALVLISMTLAFLKELALLPYIELLGVRLMVSLHGLINSIFVPILFFLAIRLEFKKDQLLKSI